MVSPRTYADDLRVRERNLFEIKRSTDLSTRRNKHLLSVFAWNYGADGATWWGLLLEFLLSHNVLASESGYLPREKRDGP
jgi:hypothetical protein